MQSKITAITSGAATNCSYDSQSKIMSVSVANLDIIFSQMKNCKLYQVGTEQQHIQKTISQVRTN